MNILRILMPSLMEPDSPCGVSRYYLTLAEALRQNKHIVNIVTPSNASVTVRLITGFMRRLASRAGIACDLLFQHYRDFYRIRDACNKQPPPNIIHAQDPVSARAASLAMHEAVPVIMTTHFNDHPISELRLRLNIAQNEPLTKLTELYHKFFKNTGYYICPSSYVARKIAEFTPENRLVSVVPCPLDFSKIRQQQLSNPLPSYPPNFRIVMNAGYLEPRKNQRFFLEIAENMREDPVIFWIVGDGPDRLMLQNRIIQTGLQDRVHLLGHRNDIGAVMKKSHLYVHTALSEMFGMVLTEAIACGLPVLGPDVGGIGDIVADSKADSLFSKNDSAQLVAQKIRCLIENKDALRSLATKQFEYAAFHFDVERVTNSVIESYKMAIEHYNKADKKT